jgi:hypothetical protein
MWAEIDESELQSYQTRAEKASSPPTGARAPLRHAMRPDVSREKRAELVVRPPLRDTRANLPITAVGVDTASAPGMVRVRLAA